MWQLIRLDITVGVRSSRPPSGNLNNPSVGQAVFALLYEDGGVDCGAGMWHG